MVISGTSYFIPIIGNQKQFNEGNYEYDFRMAADTFMW